MTDPIIHEQPGYAERVIGNLEAHGHALADWVGKYGVKAPAAAPEMSRMGTLKHKAMSFLNRTNGHLAENSVAETAAAGGHKPLAEHLQRGMSSLAEWIHAYPKSALAITAGVAAGGVGAAGYGTYHAMSKQAGVLDDLAGYVGRKAGAGYDAHIRPGVVDARKATVAKATELGGRMHELHGAAVGYVDATRAAVVDRVGNIRSTVAGHAATAKAHAESLAKRIGLADYTVLERANAALEHSAEAMGHFVAAHPLAVHAGLAGVGAAGMAAAGYGVYHAMSKQASEEESAVSKAEVLRRVLAKA
jgi:hypothetical protein